MRLKPTDEAMTVHAFIKGMLSGPFSESLLRFYPKTFNEIRRWALGTSLRTIESQRNVVSSI